MHRVEYRRWGRLGPLKSGLALAAIRQRLRISPKQVCESIGMTRSQLSDIERGIQPVSLKRLSAMSRLYQDDLAEVITLVLQEKLNDAGFEYLEVKVAVRDEAACNEVEM